jgi:hypothetical protein
MDNAHPQDMGPSGHPRLRVAPGLLILGALLAAGCDTSPTEPGTTLDAAQHAAAVQEVWTDLPSSADLEAEAWAAVESGTIAGDPASTLLDAAELATEAALAHDVGVADDAERLADTADDLARHGFLAALGSDIATRVLDGVMDARAHLARRLGPNVGGGAASYLSEADSELDLAAGARARGDHAAVLFHAGRASDALRWLDPEGKAKAAVARAHVLLDYALRLAGDDPETPIARALNRASQLCSAARAALGREQWRLAVAEARACARLSRAVIVRLAGGIDDDTLAKRAEEAVAHAGGLLERATAMAGDAPSARVAELLAEAEALLQRSEAALEEDRFRVAIGLAIESSARSLRVMRLLWDGDLPAVELRARAAVEVALAMEARVDEQITDETAPEVLEADARADALVREAEEALEAGQYREAWVKARTAVGIYARILLSLS